MNPSLARSLLLALSLLTIAPAAHASRAPADRSESPLPLAAALKRADLVAMGTLDMSPAGASESGAEPAPSQWTHESVAGRHGAPVAAQRAEGKNAGLTAPASDGRAVFVADPRSPGREVRIAGLIWPEDPDAACVAKRFADALLAREGARPVRRGKRQAARIELTVLWLPGGHHGYDEYWDPEREETRVDFAQVLVATGAAVVDPKPLQTSRRQVCGLRIGEEIAERGYRGAWAPALQMGSCGDLSVQWSIFLGEENAQALVVWIRDELACLPVACGGGTPEVCDQGTADLVRWLHETAEPEP